MFIPKGYKRVLICIAGRVPFQSPGGFALIHGSCQNTCLLLGNLQKVDLRHSNFWSFRRSEVGIGEKKRMTAVSFTKKSDFFTPKIVKHVFWIFCLSSAWGHIHIQRSHRLFRWLLERAQKRPRIPEMMSCVKPIMVMLCSNTYKKWLQHHVILNLFAFDVMICHVWLLLELLETHWLSQTSSVRCPVPAPLVD